MNRNCVAIENAYDYNPLSVNKAMDALCDDLGMPTDNPFSSFIQPGMKVFIKPNWVASRWRESADHRDTLYSVITHEAVIEAVADRVVRALQGKGELVIGDNPSIDADFEELMRFNGIRRLEQKYNVKTTVIDMRPLVCTDLKYYNQKDKMEHQSGDPLGEVQVNLGNDSLLSEVDSSLFQGVFNEREETVAAHTGDTQLYTYGRSLYDADVYISIPKLKTHQKVGATLNLKGLVGSITRKNQLVHWRVGSPETGGDEYPNADSLEASKHAKVTHRGAWPGNDTIWRMVVDLYKGMLLKPERKYFTVVDGIIGGEGQGPFCPYAKRSNVLLAGSDLLITDIVSARLMGLDPMKVRYLEYFIETGMAFLDKIIIKSSNPQYGADFFNTNDRYLDFQLVDKWNCVKV